MKLHKAAHAVYKTQYHIVWITQYWKKILVTGVRNYLKTKLQEIRKYYPDWEYIKIGIKKDHVRLYMVIPPKYDVSKVVETIKKNISRSLSRKFAFLEKVYCDRKSIWGKGYCEKEHITFTRSRPYRKNDSCFVEQKNYSDIRRAVGYSRHDTDNELNILNEHSFFYNTENSIFLSAYSSVILRY